MSAAGPGAGGEGPLAQRGFSLLELLVALFVVILVTSLVTLNIGSGDRDIRLVSKLHNLVDVAAYALDEAQFFGVDYGLLLQRVEDNGELVYAYAWRERRPEGWRLPHTGKEVFGERQFSADIELFLELEDVPVPEIVLAASDLEVTPQVVLYSSGETTPGAIDVRRRSSGELLWRIEWDLLGRFTMLQRGEQDTPL